jgi:hypothetical protein
MKPVKPLELLISTVRNRKILLDADLAEIYGVPTKRLNEQVKRNIDRFPEDFLFQLAPEEWSQIATTNLKSQTATSSHGGRRNLPWAFTEHGKGVGP